MACVPQVIVDNPGGFDYAALSPELRKALAKQAELIRVRIQKTTTAIIEIGRDLIAVKQKIDHGLFIKWLEAEFAFTAKSAQNYMSAAEWAEGKSEMISFLAPTALYKISAKSTPLKVVKEVEIRASAGIFISGGCVERMLADARLERRQAEREEREKARRNRLSKKQRENEDKRKADWQRQREAEEAAAKVTARTIVERFGPECAEFLYDLKNIYQVLLYLKREIDAQKSTAAGAGG
jgi:hypothetical protein